MITDAEELMKMTNDFKCYSCEKKIDPDNDLFFEISLRAGAKRKKQNKSQVGYNGVFQILSSKNFLLKKGYVSDKVTGYGAILRFHVECFKEVAGEEYCFDQKIWK